VHELRYRQVHLDFHTSPEIPGIGAGFDRAEWQEALKRGRVNSITCFAVCHHGWSYNDTRVGRRHPHLEFDLLRAQYEASKEIDVNVPIYISAGFNVRAAEEHPEWRGLTPGGELLAPNSSPLRPGFTGLCFNSPYLDHLLDLIREVVEQYPDCDGIFLDIIRQAQCCCGYCMQSMSELGLDPEKEDDRLELSRRVLERYYRTTTDACRSGRADMPVFHNSGHIRRGRRDLLEHFSHLEIESLPTGGWGYDHFPVSARYCANTGLDFLGMTGKFHTTWGEFGGYKHPNALRYECAAMMAFGAKCSVGDQLHPSGRMDESTYAIIGEAYAEVEAREPWCAGARNVADVGVLSSEAVNPDSGRENPADYGAARVLLESGVLFDVIDGEMSFEPYRVLLLPDDVRLDGQLRDRLEKFVAGGGRLLLSGRSGMWRDRDEFALDIGADHEGTSPFQPDYVLPRESLSAGFLRQPLVMYAPSQRIRVREGAESLGEVYDPYFNRDFRHFCSHQHAPARPESSGFDCGVLSGAIMYLAHPLFGMYWGTGAVAHRQYAQKAVLGLLGEDVRLRTSMPSTARVSLTRQEELNREVLHLLYAATVRRGGKLRLSDAGLVRDTYPLEVIEELTPLDDVRISLRPAGEVRRVTLEPRGEELPFEVAADGRLELTVASFTCHQMVVFQY